jgi:hypothetical protein
VEKRLVIVNSLFLHCSLTQQLFYPDHVASMTVANHLNIQTISGQDMSRASYSPSNGVLSSKSTTIPDNRFPLEAAGGGFSTTSGTTHQTELIFLTLSVIGEIVMF